MFTGNMIDGRTAAEWGLVNACVPADELENATKKLAVTVTVHSIDLAPRVELSALSP
jgi:enoyl-CoA hydratase/carnithine racemase